MGTGVAHGTSGPPTVEMLSNRAWPVASAVAILLLVLLVPFMMWYQSVQARESAGAR